MAGPNRPDESPKDFSFLNTDSVSGTPSFPTLDETPAASLPEMNFDSSPEAVPDLSGLVAETVSFPSATAPALADDQTAASPIDADQTVMMSAPKTDEPAELPEAPAAEAPEAIAFESALAVPESIAATETTVMPEPEPKSEAQSDAKPTQPTTKPSTTESKASEKPVAEKKAFAPSEKKSSSAIQGYAIAITLLMIFCLMTGRLKLFGNAALESLPDIRPLDSNEFRRVPDGTPVPEGHVLKLGESRRFGDVVLTPVKVTREPLMFEQFQTKAPATTLTTDPVLKLWLRFENLSGSYAFPPFDAGLMSHRTPRFSTDESTIVNSMLNVSSPGTSSPVRVLNFLQTMDNAFVIVGQQSGKVIVPEETLETFIACSEDIQYITPTAETGYTWRVQFRKGVHESSGHGVTTLVDVLFSETDITDAAPPTTPAAG
jgi:hypothetical protein